MLADTIAAIATPLGEGGLAVVRLSGAKALEVADRCFRKRGVEAGGLLAAASHTVHYGHVVWEGRVVDEVLATVMRAPRTFTREDTVEMSCHGGVLVTRAVLDALLAGGARLAEPGEFTRRAFLNGRLDLAQAEAVADLIHARTRLALAAANEQLAGHLSRRIEGVRDELMRVLAHVEAHLDFPEEDIAPETQEALGRSLERADSSIGGLLRAAVEGQVLRRGVRAVIVGQPNVGKSSLLNRLLGHDRAIVSALPGTTRDTIEETADIRGVPVVLVDTAGLRESGDEVEREGVRRSRTMLERADLVLLVLDGSEPMSAFEHRQLEETSERCRVVVVNKSDLPQRLELGSAEGAAAVRVCALTGDGMEALKDRIRALFAGGELGGELLQVMINARHQDALRRAGDALQRARGALGEGLPLELAALDLRVAVQAVGEIVGKTTTEDLLDRVFAEFCIGK